MVSGQMATAPEAVTRRRGNMAGLVCTAVVALFLAFDTCLKVLRLAPAVEETTVLGYPAESVMLQCRIAALPSRHERNDVHAAVSGTGGDGGAGRRHRGWPSYESMDIEFGVMFGPARLAAIRERIQPPASLLAPCRLYEVPRRG